MHSTIIEKQKQSFERRAKRVEVNLKKAIKRKDLNCMRKVQENDDKNKQKIKSIKKLHKNTIKLLNKSNTRKMERLKEDTTTIISSLSSALEESTNNLNSHEKEIEENKEEMECKIEEMKCRHNTQIVSLKNQLKVHEEKRYKMEWIFGRQTENPFLKNVGSEKDNSINFLDQVSKQVGTISPEDLCKYFLQTQSIIQQSAMLRMEAEQGKDDLERICSDQKQQMIDMKQRLDNAIDTILDLQQQNKETPLQFTLCKTTVANPSGKGANRKWDVEVVFLIMQLLVGGAKPTAIHAIMQVFNYQYTGKISDEIPSVSFIRKCRMYCYIMNDILAAIRLGKVARWPAFYHDGTSRRQLSLYNLLIAIEDQWSNGNGNDSPMIVSSCMVPIDGTAHGIKNTIETKVRNSIIIVLVIVLFISYF